MKEMTNRLLSGELDTLSTNELLKALLAYGTEKRINPERDARRIIEHYGTLGDVLTEDTQILMKQYKLDERCIALLNLARAVAEHLAREKIRSRDVVSSMDALIDYLKMSLSHRKTEHAVVLFLDAKNGIIQESVVKGTVNHSPIYPREIAKQALQLTAMSIILVHNHPSGDPRPSLADVQITDKIVRCCKSLDIHVVDHVIIGRSRYVSFRDAGLIRDHDAA